MREVKSTTQNAVILARLRQVTEDLCGELAAMSGGPTEALKIIATGMLANAISLNLSTGSTQEEILIKCKHQLDFAASRNGEEG
jgi:hypothetical protein